MKTLFERYKVRARKDRGALSYILKGQFIFVGVNLKTSLVRDTKTKDDYMKRPPSLKQIVLAAYISRGIAQGS